MNPLNRKKQPGDRQFESLSPISCGFLLPQRKEGRTMRKTKEREGDSTLAVDLEKLAGMLSCGTATARQIGEAAGARIVMERRVLYSVTKVQKYLELIAT